MTAESPPTSRPDRVTSLSAVDFVLRAPFIQLDALLKATGIASSGGDAKTMVLSALVTVDGQVEQRRSRKLRGGQLVGAAGRLIRVVDGLPDAIGGSD